MTSIWAEDDTGWKLLAPVGFPDEASLHQLIEKAPELLPLSGSPRLVVLGREVPLGTGYADLLAVEPSGRLALIEMKLARNAEARRAVVAQVLAYAAFLRGTGIETLERDLVRTQLDAEGAANVTHLVESQDPTGVFDPDEFRAGLSESLRAGRFRLVLVLDDAPSELVKLVGYLESVAPELVIDLVTVSSYELGGNRVLVPQRVDPDRSEVAATAPPARGVRESKKAVRITVDEYEDAISDAASSGQAALAKTLQWAKNLEREGLARLVCYRGTTGRTILLPHLPTEDAGLVTIFSDDRGYRMALWRSVFERRAPASIPTIERLIAPIDLGVGKEVSESGDELLSALTAAYREASGDNGRRSR